MKNSIKYAQNVSIDIKKVQEIYLKALKIFDEFMNIHNAKYFIMFGTLLGAVRHKGFIPWDDDVDVAMLRSDYEKIFSFIEEIEKFSDGLLVTDYYQKNPNCVHSFVRVGLKGTHTKSAYLESKYCDQIHIDIFVLDNIPANKDEYHKIFKKIKHLRYIEYLKTKQYPNNFIKKIFTYFAKVFLKFRSLRKINFKINKLSTLSHNVDKDRVRQMNATLLPPDKKIMKTKDFENISFFDFEKIKLPGPTNYDSVLKDIYGDDYMTPIQRTSANPNIFTYYVDEDMLSRWGIAK